MLTYTKNNLYIYEAKTIKMQSSFIDNIEFYNVGFIEDVYEVAIWIMRKNNEYDCYNYKDVSTTDLLNLLNSESVGRAYNQYIKKTYKCTKVF